MMIKVVKVKKFITFSYSLKQEGNESDEDCGENINARLLKVDSTVYSKSNNILTCTINYY